MLRLLRRPCSNHMLRQLIFSVSAPVPSNQKARKEQLRNLLCGELHVDLLWRLDCSQQVVARLLPLALRLAPIGIACCLSPKDYRLLRIAYRQSPIANCLSPIGHCLLPIACRLSHCANCLMPIFYYILCNHLHSL